MLRSLLLVLVLALTGCDDIKRLFIGSSITRGNRAVLEGGAAYPDLLGGRFKSRVDMTKIAVSGHSRGGCHCRSQPRGSGRPP